MGEVSVSGGTPPSMTEYLIVAVSCRPRAHLWVAVVSSWLFIGHVMPVILAPDDSEFKGSLACTVSSKANGAKWGVEESEGGGDNLCSHLLGSPAPRQKQREQSQVLMYMIPWACWKYNSSHLFSFPLTYKIITGRAPIILWQKAIVPLNPCFGLTTRQRPALHNITVTVSILLLIGGGTSPLFYSVCHFSSKAWDDLWNLPPGVLGRRKSSQEPGHSLQALTKHSWERQRHCPSCAFHFCRRRRFYQFNLKGILRSDILRPNHIVNEQRDSRRMGKVSLVALVAVGKLSK